MADDVWFDSWYEEEAVELLSEVYRNPDKSLRDIYEEDLDFGYSVWVRLMSECRERGLLKTKRSENLGRNRVTDAGRRFLLRRDPPGFVRERLSAVVKR